MSDERTRPLITMRPAEERDRWTVWEWRNRPELYAVGDNPNPVTREEHDAWFTEVLGPNHALWILEPNAGTARLDYGTNIAWLTIYLLPEFQGKGCGPAIIETMCRIAFAEYIWLREIRAAVHLTNERSMKAFTKAGFHAEMVKCR